MAIVGPAGTGKSWLAYALGSKACRANLAQMRGEGARRVVSSFSGWAIGAQSGAAGLHLLVIGELRAGTMSKAADLVEQTVHETMTYYAFPDIHWQKIRTTNPWSG